jgi:hypothetical protein
VAIQCIGREFVFPWGLVSYSCVWTSDLSTSRATSNASALLCLEPVNQNLQAHFEQYGSIASVKCVRDASDGSFKGSAFIEFKDKTSADGLLAEAKPLSAAAAAAHDASKTITKRQVGERRKVVVFRVYSVRHE